MFEKKINPKSNINPFGMQRSILRTVFILLIVIVAGAFSHRAGKGSVIKKPARHASFMENYIHSIGLIKTGFIKN